MRPHLVIKFKDDAFTQEAANWVSAIRDKSGLPRRIHRSVDQILEKCGIPFFNTREHVSADADWNAAERECGLNRIYRLILREGHQIPNGLVERIRLLPEIEYAEQGKVIASPLPKFRRESAIQLGGMRRRYDSSRRAIGLPSAHHFTEGDEEIIVAILDTGVDIDHEALSSKMLSGYDFVDILPNPKTFFEDRVEVSDSDDFVGDRLNADDDPDDKVGHGTHVAGIIVGSGDRIPLGVAPQCRVLPIRVLAAMRSGGRIVGAGLLDNINDGIKYAVDQGAHILNMSLGVRHTGGGLPHQDVVNYALRKGVSIIAASGNDGREQLYYPGALDGVVAVGATDSHTGEVASFSTYGPQVSLVAPGTEIFSSYPDDSYAFSTGTSHAAPFVTGAVALLKSFALRYGVRLSDRQIKHVLKHTADKIDRRFKSRRAGFGQLNLEDSLRLLQHQLN